MSFPQTKSGKSLYHVINFLFSRVHLCHVLTVVIARTVVLFVRIFWESKKFEGLTDLAEPWYGTSYSVQKITSDTIKVRPSDIISCNLK
jgi:hypothetical protein